MVKRISERGELKNFVYSDTPWSPTGGVFDNAGNLWLLETSPDNHVRLRKVIASAFRTAIKPAGYGGYIMPTGLFLSLIIICLILFKSKNIPADPA